jgi:CheY-like chemotaxis protein
MSHDPRLSVLVVEDESLILAWIAGWLESKGCTVLEAETAEAALAYLSNGHAIDAVVTDIRLGDGRNGWDVAEAARARRPDIRVVYTSGSVVSPRRDLPGSVFLAKPYTAEAVYRACCGSQEDHMEALQLDPSRPPPPIMERAYELAGSGNFTDVEAICHHLIKERYEDVFLWFEGRAATRVDLLNRCRRARSQIGTPSSQPSPTSSRASRWRTKAAEFCMLADRAKSNAIRQLYLRLAESYERLASSATIEDRDSKVS